MKSQLKIKNSKLIQSYIIAAILLTATVLTVSTLQYKPTQDKKASLKNIQALPLQIGKWKGKDFPLEEDVYEILETRAIIHRSYTKENQVNVFLSIVHYNDTKIDFHAPEACLGGRGLSTQKQTKKITMFLGTQQKTINIAQVIATNSDHKTLTYYFYKTGHFLGNNYIKMRLSIAANKLTQNDTKGSLIRISTILLPQNKAATESQLVEFMEDIFPYIHQFL